MTDGQRYLRYAEVPYLDQLTVSPNTPADVLEKARKAAEAGVRRKQMTEGEMGLFSHMVELPSGYEVPLHSHDHDEMIVVLEGECTMSDGTELQAGDVALLKAGVAYGFTAGGAGLKFLNIRRGVASLDFAG